MNNERFSYQEFSSGGPWRLLLFLFIIFTAAFLLYIGLLYGYQPFLRGLIEDKKTELNGLSVQIESTDQKSFIAFYSQVVNLRELLTTHIFSSKLFPLLETLTSAQVQYQNVSFSTAEKTVTLDGFAESYEALARQMAIYRSGRGIQKVVLEGTQASDRGVRFSARLTLDPDFYFDARRGLEVR